MIDFTVIPDSGERYRVKATSRDILAWEKISKGKSFSKLMEDLPMADLYRMAHLASRRQGMFAGTLEDFEAGCELDFESTDTADTDPTQPARSPAPSSP